ncbi:hypothetical protein HaLaN_32501, partial [Haematococcus lacustris]
MSTRSTSVTRRRRRSDARQSRPRRISSGSSWTA